MRHGWNHRRCRRKCPRPPRRVHIGHQPFQVKQLAYAVEPEEHDDCCWHREWGRCHHCCPGSGGFPPFHPPLDEENPEPVALEDNMPEGFPGQQHHPCPPPMWPHPPCPDCNLRIKVLKFNACHKAQSGVIIGLFVHNRLVRTAETDAHGKAVFSYLHPGFYSVRELEVPSGVEEDTTRYAVYLSQECTSAVVVFRKGQCKYDCPDMSRWWPENNYHS